jgi:uncharacterized protein YggE
MKQIQTIIHTVFACATIFFLIAFGIPNARVQAATASPTAVATTASPAAPSGCDPARAITVSGTAVVNIAPDRALVKLGVQSNGRSPKEVQSRNASSVENVIRRLKLAGVEARDVSTDRYVIQPLYEDYDSLVIKGYRIDNTLSITVRDVSKTSDLIATAFEAGANQVRDVEFYTSDLRKYRDQAREMAMKAAREKAQALTQAAGTDMGCVLSISENSSSYFNGWSWWYGNTNNQNLWTQNAMQNVAPSNGGAGAALDDSPLMEGTISVRAEISAVFALK